MFAFFESYYYIYDIPLILPGNLGPTIREIW